MSAKRASVSLNVTAVQAPESRTVFPRHLAPKMAAGTGVAVQTPPKKLKWSRASKPKARTGCKTCKIRRVKCDEGRPSCARCRKSSLICDGYDKRPSAKRSGDTTHLTLRPKNTAALASDRRISRLQVAIVAGPSVKRFSGPEVPFIDFFRHGLVDDLAGYSYSEFWTRVVLSEAMETDCVRDAVLAISALSRGVSTISTSPQDGRRTKATGQPSALSPWTASHPANDYHRAALRYYVKALSIFRKRVLVGVETKAHSPRTVFIMTLLLLVFELIQGNMDAVDQLLTNSIRLLNGSFGEYGDDPCGLLPHKPSHAKIRGDLHEMEYVLPFLSLMGTASPFLKTQWDNLSLWSSSSASETSVPTLPQSPKELQASWDSFTTHIMAFGVQAMAPPQPGLPARDFLQEQQTYLSHLARWQTVLAASLARAIIADDTRAQRALQMMQLHRLMLCILVQCALDRTDMAWDACEPQFRLLLEGCLAFVVQHRPHFGHAAFTLNMGVLSALGPIIGKCRNHGIRMRALEVARHMPWREGAWDAGAEMFGKLGAVLLEEKGRDGQGFISRENRWTWMGGDWSAERGTLVGQYLRSAPDEAGVPVTRSLELGLDAWPDICHDIGCVVDHGVGCEALKSQGSMLLYILQRF